MSGMKNAVNFEALRRKRKRAKRVKTFFALLVTVFLAGVAIYSYQEIIKSDLSASLSDTVGGFGGSGYPVEIPGSSVKRLIPMGSNLVMINDAGLYIYNSKGKNTSHIQQMGEQSIALVTPKRILLYDYGGKKIVIHSSTKELYTHQYDDIVVGAALGENGAYAVVTSPKRYVAKVTAYNASNEAMLNWFSPEEFVISTAIDRKGEMMVVSTIGAKNGLVKSSVHFLRFGMEKEIAIENIENEIITWTGFLSDNRFAVLTDKSYRVYDAAGKNLAEYIFAQNVLSFKNNGKNMLVLCGTNESREKNLLLLDDSCKELGNIVFEDKCIDMAVYDSEIYVLSDKNVHVFNLSLAPRDTYELKNANKIAIVNGKIYYTTHEEICILPRKSATEESNTRT